MGSSRLSPRQTTPQITDPNRVKQVLERIGQTRSCSTMPLDGLNDYPSSPITLWACS
jgi:hypothetical protein